MELTKKLDSPNQPEWALWNERISEVQEYFQKKGMTKTTTEKFQRMVYDHYHNHGRHDLAWRNTDDPYRIVVSEIMLQQTQVERVRQKYPDFIRTFPDWQSLKEASLQHILRIWQGMGYNRRALALKKIAHLIMGQCNGKVPDKVDMLMSLPGIGRATAGALCAFIYDLPVVFIETNIRTVFLHCFYTQQVAVTDQEILARIAQTLDQENPRDWYQALMDFGVTIKKNVPNPNRSSAVYRKQSSFKGSDREIRGEIIAVLLKNHEISEQELYRMYKCPKKRLKCIINKLIADGLVEKHRSCISIRKNPGSAKRTIFK
jgi:A/G-specific adenine glycosylase